MKKPRNYGLSRTYAVPSVLEHMGFEPIDMFVKPLHLLDFRKIVLHFVLHILFYQFTEVAFQHVRVFLAGVFQDILISDLQDRRSAAPAAKV